MPHHAPRALWATKISAQDAPEGAHIMTQGRIQNFVLEGAREIKIGKLIYLCQLIAIKFCMLKVSSLVYFIYKAYKYCYNLQRYMNHEYILDFSIPEA